MAAKAAAIKVRVEQADRAELERYAARDQRTVSGLLRAIVAEYLERRRESEGEAGRV